MTVRASIVVLAWPYHIRNRADGASTPSSSPRSSISTVGPHMPAARLEWEDCRYLLQI